MVNENDPVNIILITSGSRGQRLLFRYPFQNPSGNAHQPSPVKNYVITEDLSASFNNPYKLIDSDDTEKSTQNNFLQNGELFGFEDALLANMLAPKLTLCDDKFELKIDHIKFVGFPVLVTHDDDSGFEDCLITDESSLLEHVMIKMVHVVLVVHGNTSARMINHYQNVSKMLGKALRHEEKRCRYLSAQREIMVSERDNAEKLPEDDQNPHEMILKKCKLAQDIAAIFDSMCQTGIVKIAVNGWLNLNYCLPHKIHRLSGSKTMINAEKFSKYINRIKPYHTLLLTDEGEREQENLMKLLPHDASPMLLRLIKLSNHIKNFQTLCQDADISLPQIFQIVAHLVYWGRCTVIYPLAESNVYVISENASTEIDSKHAEEFVRSFPKQSLHNILARFSFPTTLGEYRNPLYNSQQQLEQAQIVTWLLKRRLLKQLHTYVWIMPEVSTAEEGMDESFLFDETLSLKPIERRIFDKFSYAEKKSLIKMQNMVDKEDLSFFLNMSKYFRGDHHLEDIMYYENVPRSKLLILIDKFRTMLITVQHEDAATSRMV
ncbi:GATOR complex protein NPRL3-like [Hydractinia symbiolongicarpus]|uniref:GATOR complex protein NPRL3-like n=1 Tax=Hydractinia symbiolongicarpus TaxID=13093 RepID=UPI00254FEFC2|nr:GATOR complex protein NPRL3-like [Hydractinia symbiolongicarpus]